jgi:hypothetical protein
MSKKTIFGFFLSTFSALFIGIILAAIIFCVPLFFNFPPDEVGYVKILGITIQKITQTENSLSMDGEPGLFIFAIVPVVINWISLSFKYIKRYEHNTGKNSIISNS